MMPFPATRMVWLLATALIAVALLFPDSSAAVYLDIKAHVPDAGTTAPPVDVMQLPASSREAASRLIMQDYQGRMKPIDTLARALVRKSAKRFELEGMDPVDMYLSWMANPNYWWNYPLLKVRYPGLRDMLELPAGVTHVAPRSLLDDQGQYLLGPAVEQAHQTPDRDRSKLQRKLIDLDERVNLVFLAIQGRSMRIFPLPGDSNNTWLGGEDAIAQVSEPVKSRYRKIWLDFLQGLQGLQIDRFDGAVAALASVQTEFGASVVPSAASVKSELFLNRLRPFSRVLYVYFLASILLIPAYFLCLLRRGGQPFTWRHPLYLAGMGLFVGGTIFHLAAYVMRWLASGRAPLSNGYESLVFISLSVALAGLAYELKDRRSVSAGLSALLTFVILGISMMSFFDPAIGLLVPVLNSYWLNIHVTIITASYGFLGLGSLIGALMLILYLLKGPRREAIRDGIRKLEGLLFNVIIVGLGLLTVGTLLGGVWANESWGRYWGWDPKETWSLVTILAYTVISHIRLIPMIRKPWMLAAGSFAGISTVIMTFFGVNYFLQGLHSYASGGAMRVPSWVYIGAFLMVALIVSSFVVAKTRSWDEVGRVPTRSTGSNNDA